MGVNGTYPNENPISDGDKLLASSEETGKTTQISVRDLSEYIQTRGTGKIAVYDGATDVAPYSETFIAGTQVFDLRLGLSGPLSDDQFFPEVYGTIMTNQLSAPAKSEFDFRFLPLGTMIEFDVEFLAVVQDSGSGTISPNEDHNFNLVVEYPNGTQDLQSFVMKTATNAGLGLATSHKFRFVTYIKDELTDSLIGGGFILNSVEAGVNLVTITKFKVSAII